MSFLAFNPGARRLGFRGIARRGHLRERIRDEREFAAIGAPSVCGGGNNNTLDWLRESFHSNCGGGGVCLIERPLCNLVEPSLGGWPERYGNATVPFAAGNRNVYGFASTLPPVAYNYYGRGGAGGWQQIGYLLPLHVAPTRRRSGAAYRCTCTASQRRQQSHMQRYAAPTRGIRQPSRFQSSGALEEPYDSYNTAHEPGCPLAVDDDERGCQNRQCGVRRYHLYVRIDPDRLGQQCLYTSARRGDHRYNNCRYLQFGVSEEGVHDSAIIILTRDFIIDGSNSQRLVSTGASRCIEDGDVLFVPGEGNRKFRVTLYDDRIYDGYC